MKYAMNKKVFAKSVGILGRSTKEMNTLVQQLAVAAIAFSVCKDRNATPAQQLLDVVNPHFKHALVGYFEKHGNLAWDKTSKKVVFFDVGAMTDREPLAWTDDYADTVMASSWIEGRPVVQPKSVFDVSEEFGALIDRLTKKASKGAEIKNADLLTRIVATYNRYNAEVTMRESVADGKVLDKSEEAERVSAARLAELAARHPAATQAQ